jgi:hypothetical protein
MDPVVPLGSLFLMADARQFMVAVAFDFSLASSVTATSLGLGVYYPLRAESDSAYAGASLRWSSVRLGGEGERGAAIAPALGWIGRRYHHGKVHAQLEYFVALFKELSHVARVRDRASIAHVGHGPQLWLGVSW